MGISARPLLQRRPERNQISRVMFNMEAGADGSCRGRSALLSAADVHGAALWVCGPDGRDATGGKTAPDEVYSCFALLERHRA